LVYTGYTQHHLEYLTAIVKCLGLNQITEVVGMKFEIRVAMPHGGQQQIIIEASNRRNAESSAASQTGGRVLGGRQLPT
jgi:hypothetical protein